MGYDDLKEIKVKIVNKTHKMVVLQVTVVAKNFTSDFSSLKQVMNDTAQRRQMKEVI